jgi:hypothetical protein
MREAREHSVASVSTTKAIKLLLLLRDTGPGVTDAPGLSF